VKIYFTNELRRSRYDELLEYLRGQRLWLDSVKDYPDHEQWLNKVDQELKSRIKRALVAFDGRRIIGATIYQKHKQIEHTLEMKNLTVRPEKRGRFIASFLLRNTEIEGVHEFGARRITFDAKKRNAGIRHFAQGIHRYEISEERDIYGLGAGRDVVFVKELTKHS
jgi:ribosomal protein S18 acetylase RimI-like enzyme